MLTPWLPTAACGQSANLSLLYEHAGVESQLHSSYGACSPEGPAWGEHTFASLSEGVFQPIINMGQQKSQRDGDNLAPIMCLQAIMLFS